jgi:hypothetical protein
MSVFSCECCFSNDPDDLVSMSGKYITINGQEISFIDVYKICMKITKEHININRFEDHKICKICSLQIENVYKIRLKYAITHPPSLTTESETEIKEEDAWGHQESVFVLDSSDHHIDYTDSEAHSNFQDDCYEDSDDEPLLVPIPVKSVRNQYTEKIPSPPDLSTENGTKPAACNESPNSFDDEKNLNSHMFSHGLCKKFQCKLCKRSFKHHSTLCTHIKTKHPGADYPKDRKVRQKREDALLCTHCGKTFKFQSLLDYHIDKYSTDRNYNCPNCPKTYRCRSILNQHIKLKHSSKVINILKNDFHD